MSAHKEYDQKVAEKERCTVSHSYMWKGLFSCKDLCFNKGYLALFSHNESDKLIKTVPVELRCYTGLANHRPPLKMGDQIQIWDTSENKCIDLLASFIPYHKSSTQCGAIQG